MIKVKQTGQGDPLEFHVVVGDGRGEQDYRVTVSRADWIGLTGGAHSPQHSILAVFRFLLERERRESILSSFDVSVVSGYFPEFDKELPTYLARPADGAGDLD